MTNRLRDDCFALPPGVEWTPAEQALARLRETMRPLTGTETVRLEAAHGRFLAEAPQARRANPPADNSAVDGYAFAWTDAKGPRASLRLAEGRSAAGAPFPQRLTPGEAVRILTGAVVPKGADSVVLQEDAELAEGRVTFVRPRQRGANVRAAGEDAAFGAPLLDPGTRIGPAALARLAIAGVDRVVVHRPIKLAILSTGDELLEPGANPAAPGIFDANRPMLAAMGREFGFEVIDLGIAPDREAAVAQALDEGSGKADAIVTSGGASAGDEDHISRTLSTKGRVETWRIAIKPGRPLALGFWEDTPLFGLPGNPVAAFVCFLMFARPALLAMAGAGWRIPPGFHVPAAFEKNKKPGRREYLRARLRTDGSVEVFHSEGSGLIGGLTWSDGLVELDEEAREIRKGDPVKYLPFSSFGLS